MQKMEIILFAKGEKLFSFWGGGWWPPSTHGPKEASLRSAKPTKLGSAPCNMSVAGFKENNVEPK